jgi:hypothetical protein
MIIGSPKATKITPEKCHVNDKQRLMPFDLLLFSIEKFSFSSTVSTSYLSHQQTAMNKTLDNFWQFNASLRLSLLISS